MRKFAFIRYGNLNPIAQATVLQLITIQEMVIRHPRPRRKERPSWKQHEQVMPLYTGEPRRTELEDHRAYQP